MNSQQRNELLRVILRCTGPFAFLLVLSLLAPRVSAAAGAKPSAGTSSSQGGQSASSSQSPQTPTIPLDLPVFAHCTRDPAKPKCGAAPSLPPKCNNPATTQDSASPWTAEKNCQLSYFYNHNDWKNLQALILNFKCTLKCDPALPDHAYYSVVFLNEDLPTPTLSRVLVHDDPQPEIYGNRVGGYDLYDLQLLPDFGISVRTTYQATIAPNGVIAQLPGVLAQVATGAKNIPTPGSTAGGNGTSKMIAAAIADLKDSENKMRTAPSKPSPSEATIRDNRMQIEQIQGNGLLSQTDLKRLLEQLATDRATSNQLQAIDSEAIMADPKKLADVDSKMLADADSKIIALLEAHREFVVRRVNTPRVFNRGGLRTASVIPQVSVTDQLAFSPALEEYLLSSLDLRATADDDLLNSNYCTNPPRPCAKPVSDVNKQLAAKYKKCRSDAQQAPQLTVNADHTAYATTGGDVNLTAQLSDTNSSASSAPLKAEFTSYRVDIQGGGVTPVKCLTQSLSSPQTWRGTCPINRMPPGPYLIEATASYPGAASGSAPVAKANTALVVTDSTSTGSLLLAERMPAWGVALNADFTLDVGTMTKPVHAVVRTFSAQDADRGKELTVSPAAVQPFSGIAEGTAKLDTGALGSGERLAVLTADLGTGYKSFAAVNFRVGARGTPSQAASGGPGGSSGNCNLNPSITPSRDGLTETQEFAIYQADLATTYTSLFAFSSPGQQPSPPPAPIQYTFGKLTRWSYSLGVGGMFPAFYNQPAKVSDSKFVRNPPSPALTFVAADYHPTRYDETEFSPSPGERFRFLGGIALTPNIGFVVGVGGELFRGFSLETGCSILLANVLPSGASFTTPSSNTNSTNLQTRRGFSVAPFFAIGYSLQ